MGIFVSASHSLESHNGLARRQYVFTSFVRKCKKDLITQQKPFNGNSFSLVFAPVFDILIEIHEYANEIKFSNRSMTSIHLSHDILLVQ